LNPEYVRMKLQEWLRFPSIDDRRAGIAKAHRETFRWIFSPIQSSDDPDLSSSSLIEDSDISSTPSIEDPDVSPTPSMQRPESSGSDFVEWLRNGSGVYWIQGKMGCGKSTLMKYVSENKLTENHLLEWANGQTLHCPSYYFSKTGTSELQRSLQGLYRTLLATLIQHEDGLFRIAFPYWQASDSSHEPTATVLRDALEKILTKSELSCKYCFFIDGLDEYKETDYMLKGELVKGLLELAQLPVVKLVVSSRPESTFELEFAHCPTIELHRLTRRDIVAYVDAEIRRKAIPHKLTPTETYQLTSICDEVVRKAEGVFLWVTIAVASILNGIANYETLPELSSRLNQLDPRLTVLFKQVLTERVQARHRKQVARSLLAQRRFRNLPSVIESWNHLTIDNSRNHLNLNGIIQAIIPYVDASHDCALLLDTCEIHTRVQDMRRRLPGRSSGLYMDFRTEPYDSRSASMPSRRALMLSHSSLDEFLKEHDTQTLLLEQAGEDFQAVEAITVGQIADLVYRIETEHDFDRARITVMLIDILRSIEMTLASTGLTQTKLLSIFDEVLGRDSRPLALVLADSSKMSWDPLYDDHIGKRRRNRQRKTFYWDFTLRPRGISDCGSDLLSLSISLGLTCYLKYKISEYRGVPPKAGTPLLFYPLWTLRKLRAWLGEGESPYGELDPTKECHGNLVKLLLAEDANPNERCHGITPWSVVLHRLCSGCDEDFPLHRDGPPDAITRPKRSFLDKLYISKLMLEHGADPFLCMDTPDFIISPQIFAEMLERECCSGYALEDCTCFYASRIKARLTELVELVEERRYQKRQMRTDGELLIQAAWLVTVLAYILQSFSTLFP
jgi:hypothetical protein